MGKKAETPPAPDYAAAAEKTGASNQVAQTKADYTNRPTIKTPFGTQSWEQAQGVDPGTGQPITQWTQNTTLDPSTQKSLDAQQAVDLSKSQLAQKSIGGMQDAYAQPFDWNKMSAMGAPPTGGGLKAQPVGGAGQGIMSGLGPVSPVPDAGGDMGRQRIEQGYMDRLRPQQERDQARLETQLMNSGTRRGSEIWNQELEKQSDRASRSQFDAMDRAGQEQSRQFGMELQGQGQEFQQGMGAAEFGNRAQAQGFGQEVAQAGQNFGQEQAAQGQNYNQESQTAQAQNQQRQQQIAEEQMRRAMPLNEMNAILTGAQVGMPSMPGFNTSRSSGGVDYSGAATNQNQASMDAYNAKQQQTQGLMSGLGTAAQVGMMFSDRRLKLNVVKVGDHPIGVPIYEYDIFGQRQRGVMAQDMLKVAPERVHEHRSGFLMVDYGGL